MSQAELSIELVYRQIGDWLVPALELSDGLRALNQPITGYIANAIVDGQRGKERQRRWKVKVASAVRGGRGPQPWNSGDNFAISVGMSFHLGNHGYQSLDIENFIKPILDGLAAGLFCEADTDLNRIERFDYDDSNFNTLFVHRLDDSPSPRLEGIALSVSSGPLV